MDKFIILKELRFFAHHGVDPQETAVGATFIINLKIKTDYSHALLTDELTHTVSYADVYEAVKQEMCIPSKLLEYVGGRILRRLFHDFPTIESIELELIKQNPPMGADCAGAGIYIVEQRDGSC